jgi:hypothetical protein
MAEKLEVTGERPYGAVQESAQGQAGLAQAMAMGAEISPQLPEPPVEQPAAAPAAEPELRVRGAMGFPQQMRRPGVEKTPLEYYQEVSMMFEAIGATNPVFGPLVKRLNMED